MALNYSSNRFGLLGRELIDPTNTTLIPIGSYLPTVRSEKPENSASIVMCTVIKILNSHKSYCR